MRFADATTMRVGGEVAHWVDARDRDTLIVTYRDAERDNLVLLGGGSNTVASNDDFDGAVLRVLTRGITVVEAEEQPTDAASAVLLRAEAGEAWDAVVARSVAEGLSGIEALSGIPGSVGAAPVQNIGAYGQELADALRLIEFYDAEADEIRQISAQELQFGYRDSAIKQGVLQGIVLSVELRLTRFEDGLSAPVVYEQLARALGVELGARVPLEQLRSSVLELRAAKGMVLSDDQDSVSAGSFFTNPIVPIGVARTLPADAPRWSSAPQPVDVVVPLDTVVGVPGLDYSAAARQQEMVKLSAAWLIEHAGIAKGFSLGFSKAAISTKHTLAITNRGGATGEEIAELARFVQARVENEFGVLLVPEPVLVGLAL